MTKFEAAYIEATRAYDSRGLRIVLISFPLLNDYRSFGPMIVEGIRRVAAGMPTHGGDAIEKKAYLTQAEHLRLLINLYAAWIEEVVL